MMHAFTNWKWYQERAECNDWSERPGAKYCNWDGVSCNAAGQVVTVQFLKNGSFLTGLVPPAAVSLHHEQYGLFSTSKASLSWRNDRHQQVSMVLNPPQISSSPAQI